MTSAGRGLAVKLGFRVPRGGAVGESARADLGLSGSSGSAVRQRCQPRAPLRAEHTLRETVPGSLGRVLGALLWRG